VRELSGVLRLVRAE
jgi:hypothetical protein